MREVIIYIISIGCQISGAIILLLDSFSARRESVLKRFVGRGLVFRDNNTNELKYDEKAFGQEFRVAILNKFAFGFLAIEYLVGIWGNIGCFNKWVVMMSIIAITVFLVVVCYGISCLFAKNRCKKEITNDELEKFGLEPDIENISNKQIEEIFNNMEGDYQNDNLLHRS